MLITAPVEIHEVESLLMLLLQEVGDLLPSGDHDGRYEYGPKVSCVNPVPFPLTR